MHSSQYHSKMHMIVLASAAIITGTSCFDKYHNFAHRSANFKKVKTRHENKSCKPIGLRFVLLHSFASIDQYM